VIAGGWLAGHRQSNSWHQTSFPFLLDLSESISSLACLIVRSSARSTW